MTNNKQSSLDYYITKLTEILGLYIQQISRDDNERIARLEEQAKAMHKEECIKYYVDSVDYGDMGQHIRESLIQIAEKMYNETFGGNNEQQ